MMGMTDKILGVLGGMGPLASAHFMTRLTLLTPAAVDQEHIPTILWSDPRVPDRSKASQGGPDPLPVLLRGIAGLVAAGCGGIAIPCNTAHGWYDEMAEAAGVPIFHIVDAAAASLDALVPPGSTIGVMGTTSTLQMRLYQDRLEALGWIVITPDADEMARLVSPAIASVKANDVAAAYPPLAEMVTILAGRGADAVVLGCTELPLGILAGPYRELPVPLVDTIDTLALAAIAWAKG
jgi:aspartate racemase